MLQEVSLQLLECQGVFTYTVYCLQIYEAVYDWDLACSGLVVSTGVGLRGGGGVMDSCTGPCVSILACVRREGGQEKLEPSLY